jgi:membrane protein involved in colicin uptake
MDIAIVIVVGLAVLLGIVLLVVLAQRVRQRQVERRRDEAHQHRQEAQVHAAQADRREAEAQERMGRADREQAMAREEAARAARDREAAQDRHAQADRLDPDDDGRRETSMGDPAATVGQRQAVNDTAAPVQDVGADLGAHEHHDHPGHGADPVGREHGGDPARDSGRQGIDPDRGSR